MLPFPLCSSPLKVKEDDEVDKLDIKISTSKRSKRAYPSPSPEVAMKISRSLRVSGAFFHTEITCQHTLYVYYTHMVLQSGQLKYNTRSPYT
jgi:hypothetical protein